MNFDIDSARKAGYSDAEIADFIAKDSSSNFDVSGALKAGYSPSEILSQIAAPAAAGDSKNAAPATRTPSPNLSTSVSRDEYAKAFMANNPNANPNQLAAVLAQYDQRVYDSVTAPQDEAPPAPTADGTPGRTFLTDRKAFDQRLTNRMDQGKAGGIVSDLPAVKTAAPALPQPASHGGGPDAYIDMALMSAGKTAVDAYGGVAHLLGDAESEKQAEGWAAQFGQRQQDTGVADTFGGKVAGLVGGVLPATALPEGKIAQIVGNAGLFAYPAYQATYKRKLAEGMDNASAMYYAAKDFGINLFAPMAMGPGLGKIFGNEAPAVMGAWDAAKGIARSSTEGVAFAAANSVGDKLIDKATGHESNAPWMNWEEAAVNAVGFPAAHSMHMASDKLDETNADPVHQAKMFSEALDGDVAQNLAAPHGFAGQLAAHQFMSEGQNPNEITPQQTVRPRATAVDIAAAPDVDSAIAAANAVVGSDATDPQHVANLLRAIRPPDAPATPAAPAGERIEPMLGEPAGTGMLDAAAGPQAELGQRYARVTRPDGSTGFDAVPSGPAGEGVDLTAGIASASGNLAAENQAANLPPGGKTAPQADVAGKNPEPTGRDKLDAARAMHDRQDELVRQAQAKIDARKAAPPAEKPVTLKDGSGITLHNDHVTDALSQVTARDEQGNDIGTLAYSRQDGMNPGVEVHGDWQRKGVATAMYDFAEEHGGKIPAVDAPGTNRTADGVAFRRARASLPVPKEAPAPAKLSAAQKMRERVRQSDPFLHFLANHGVSPADRADLGVEKGNAGNRMVPGFGPVIRKSGKRLDELALLAQDEGHLTQHDIDNAMDTGGTRKLASLIQRALAGKEVIKAPGALDHEGPSTDERLHAEAHSLGIETEGKTADELYDDVAAAHRGLEARRDAIGAETVEEQHQAENDADHITDAELNDAQLNDDDIPFDLNDTRMASGHDLTDEEVDALFGIQKAGGAQGDRGQDQGAAAGAAREGDARAGAAREGAHGEVDDGGDLLSSYGRDDVLQRQDAETAAGKARQAERDKLEAQRKKEMDDKDIADRMQSTVDNFQLGQTGEDALAGQSSLFDSPVPKAEPATPAERIPRTRPGNIETTVNGRQLKKLLEENRGAPLAEKPEKMAALRNGTAKPSGLPELAFRDRDGKLDVNDGRHRIALWGMENKAISVQIAREDVGRLHDVLPLAEMSDRAREKYDAGDWASAHHIGHMTEARAKKVMERLRLQNPKNEYRLNSLGDNVAEIMVRKRFEGAAEQTPIQKHMAENYDREGQPVDSLDLAKIPAARELLQEDRHAFAQPRLKTYDPKDAKPLLLIACSGAKLEGQHAARDLYQGVMFDVLRKWMPTDPMLQPHVFIISAEHGLVPADRFLDSYEREMTPERQKELMRKGIDVRDLQHNDYNQVFIAGGKLYRELGQTYAYRIAKMGALDPKAEIHGSDDGAGVGTQRGDLGEYLRNLAANPPADLEARRERDADLQARRASGQEELRASREKSAALEAAKTKTPGTNLVWNNMASWTEALQTLQARRTSERSMKREIQLTEHVKLLTERPGMIEAETNPAVLQAAKEILQARRPGRGDREGHPTTELLQKIGTKLGELARAEPVHGPELVVRESTTPKTIDPAPEQLPDLAGMFDQVLAEELNAKPAGDVGDMFDAVLAEEMNARAATPAKAEQPGKPATEKQRLAASRKPRAPAPDAERTAGEAALSAAKNTGISLASAIGGLGEIFGVNIDTKHGIMPMDESKYQKALPFFHAAVVHLGRAGTDIKDVMRAVVRSVLDKFGPETTANMKPYVVRYVEDHLAGKFNEGEPHADIGTGERTERNPGNRPDAEPAAEQDVFNVGRAAGGKARQPDVGPDEAGDGSADSAGVPGRDAAAGGAEGDRAIPGEQQPAGPAGRAAEPGNTRRSRNGGNEESQPQSRAIGEPATRLGARLSLDEKRQQQRDAERTPVVAGDRANIDATLPFLLDGQRDDVHFAETRFANPDKQPGVMFTNGTGTGKTFSGLGVAKRFQRMGKENGLIVVPNNQIAQDWIDSGKNLGLDIKPLDGIDGHGDRGMTVTTYANFGSNRTLADRRWDFVMPDEAHYLMSSKDGKMTGALQTLRALTRHPEGWAAYSRMVNRDLYDKLEALGPQASKSDGNQASRAAYDKLLSQIVEREKTQYPEFKAAASAPLDRPKTVFLSATPFAYDKSIDYAEGYLFNYPDGGRIGNSNQDGRSHFFVQHFGYRVRYHKLTEPDANVDRGLMARQFNSYLKSEGALSGRMLDVEADYDRKFIMVPSALGTKIDEGLEFIREHAEYKHLYQPMMKQFDYLSRRYLLEAIKAKESLPMIQEHLDMGRKVVIIHDYKKGGAFNPFHMREVNGTTWDSATGKNIDLAALAERFKNERSDLVNLKIPKESALDILTKAYPDALVHNGDVPTRQLEANKRLFNDDEGSHRIIILQSDKGREGISLHDTTGRFQRVEINVGMQGKPTALIQLEGRIYRTAQVSNAILRYPTTGTHWERHTFAQTIAERADTAEALAMGDLARGLKQSIVDAYEEAGPHPVTAEDGRGGKALDRANAKILTEWDRAKSMYYSQLKRNSSTKAQEGLDYYATPEPVGLKMVEWADIRPGDSVLEPSAGHGAIARWFPIQSAKTIVEPETPLIGKARLAVEGNAKFLQHHFEDLHLVNKYDAVVMNPPFGKGGALAIPHVMKAYKHLNEGGRIVALLPRGGMATGRLEKFLNSEDAPKDLHLVAEVDLPGSTFSRAGTGVMTRIVILDKLKDGSKAPAAVHREYTGAESVEDLFDHIQHASMPGRAKMETGEDVAIEEAKPANSRQPRAAAPDATGGARHFDQFDFAHTKTGEQLYGAALLNRVSPEAYRDALAIAKNRGGRYNTFAGGGAKRGFLFKSAEDRAAFMDKAGQLDDVKAGRDGGVELNDINDGKSDRRTVQVDGRVRPIRDAEGHMIGGGDFMKQQRFYKWFGDSKIADEQGRPLVVYHATTADFPEFNTDTGQLGAHFGTSEQANYMAARHAERKDEPHVVPAYLSIKNPLRLKDTGSFGGVFVRRQLKELGIPVEAGGSARQAILDAGYDGVVYANEREGSGDSWIALRPEQIKSATGNDGTYSPSDGNITRDLSAAAGRRTEAPEQKRIVTLARLKSAARDRDAGKITDEEYRNRIDDLVGQLESRNDMRSAPRDRERGPEWVQERLMRARRLREIEPEAADFALWALQKNPHLAEDLGISLRSSGDGAAGRYTSVSRIMTLFKGSQNTGTAVHEILHHTERMMPEDVQAGITEAWRKAFADAYFKADEKTRAGLEDLLKMAENQDAAKRVIDAMRDGTLTYDKHYQLSNPSEYWAVNATRIMADRYAARESWVSRAKQWMGELVQRVKGWLGARSDAAVLRGLHSVIEGDGQFESDQMLVERAMKRNPDGSRKVDPTLRDIADPAQQRQEEEKSSLAKFIKVPKEALASVVFHARTIVVPMNAGSEHAMVMAKDFANHDRKATAQWQAFDKVLRTNYTDEQLADMWEAADEENDLRREGRTSSRAGLARLDAGQRATVELLHSYGEQLWAKAQDAGVVSPDSEGVHYWTPRMAARILEDGSVEKLRQPGGDSSNDATNLRTTANSTKERKYDTTDESEDAARARLGDDVGYVRNIRVMPLAMAQLERAIVGRTLVNQVKTYGKLSGADLISEHDEEGFVTFKHPALQTWKPRMDWQPIHPDKIDRLGYTIRGGSVFDGETRLSSYRVVDGEIEQLQPILGSNGRPILEASPLYIRKDFAGPLKAVFKRDLASVETVYQRMMQVKGAVTSAIMISPLTHGLVIWGKAYPTMSATMGWKNNLKNFSTLGIHAYLVGNSARTDHGLMNELIEGGLVPVSGRGMNPDIEAIGNGIAPGRSWAAKAIGWAFDQASPAAGDTARRVVDKAGEIWHEKLLWDRVADLQAGMAVMMRTSLMDKGFDQRTATLVAAHFANRYAGMIPREAMSDAANKLLNVSLFSKTFTLTNLGAYKDLLVGLPKDVQAQIKLGTAEVQRALGASEDDANQAGAAVLKRAQRSARTKAASILLLEVSAMTMAASMAQAAFQGQSVQQFLDDLNERLRALGEKAVDDPLSILMHPMDALSSLSQTSDNPHGKEDRVRVGEDEQGNSYYLRLPFGKVGEELKQYGNLVTGMHLAHNKMSTFLRPIADLTQNEDFTGRRIIKPDENVVKQIAKMGAYWTKSQLPVEELAAARHLVGGEGDMMDGAKVGGWLTGLSVGKVSGGDVVAEMRYQKHEEEANYKDVLPDVREAVRRGDFDTAYKLLEDIGQSTKDAARIIRQVEQPDMVSKSQMRRFNSNASDSERDRLDRMRNR